MASRWIARLSDKVVNRKIEHPSLKMRYAISLSVIGLAAALAVLPWLDSSLATDFKVASTISGVIMMAIAFISSRLFRYAIATPQSGQVTAMTRRVDEKPPGA